MFSRVILVHRHNLFTCSIDQEPAMNIQNICLLLTLTGCALARDYLTDPGRMEILTLRGFDNDRLFEIFKKDYGKVFKKSYFTIMK